MEKIIVYHQRIGSLFQELVDFYTQVTKLPEIDLPGTLTIRSVGRFFTNERTATFIEQKELIRIYLKKISEEILTQDEKTLFESTNLLDGLVWNQMADFMEPLIHWSKNVIEFYNNNH